jgi:DNA polymerase III epsilon subunit family exonuclease
MTSSLNTPSDKSLRNVSFAVVDCETTGVNPETDRILQLAAIVVNGEGEIVQTFDTVVKPESPADYTHGAEHIHGISEEQVAQGMPLREALQKLWEISDGNFFTAHNAQFDIGFIHAESKRVGLERQVETYIDTLALSRKTDAEKERKHSLDALCEHYGIERDRAHEAKSDATATAQLLIHLMHDMGVSQQDQLPELFA